MKMRKLLATAVAATMAVTSLATVASAAEKSWNMGHTTGTIKFSATSGKEVNFLATEDGLAPAELGISADDTIAIITTDATKKVTGVTLKVTGVKGSKASASKTYSYAFGNYDSDTVFDWTTQKYDASGKAWALTAYATSGNLDSFVPSQFVEITQVSIEIACESEVDTAKAYDAYGSTNYGENIDGLKIIPFASAKWTDILMVINNSLNAWGTDVVASTGIYAAYSDKSTKVDYPFMPITKIDDDGKLGREEINILSSSGAYSSDGLDYIPDGSNQSYVDDDTTAGEVAKDFAGLSTQVADFFNKQTNGTITFKFTTGDEAGGTAWENGGIPSTQTGIKNFMGDATANDFALFFNYRQTGSLQAIVELDKDAGTVTFDISDILDSLGGQTLGVLDNMFYGLQKGIEYKDIGTGLMVETVTLAYDEDADVEADIEDDAEEEDDADVEIEEDDDVEIEDDADDAEEDDAGTAGDVVVEEEDDDANPGTGVALAVVPAMVAAAAVVLSKKRK